FANIFKPLASGRFCTSAVVLMFLVRSIDIAGNLYLMNFGYTPLQLLYVATNSLILDFLNMASWIIVAAAISSLIVLVSQSIHPLIEILMELAEPLSAPFRKITPNIGMLDLSPMVAILTIMLMEIILKTLAQNMLPMLVLDRETLIFTAQILDLIR
ncbi:MAG: YggT family protein, partial [Moraxellaceae bacterium]|nr:YggT family protein [Moraxellaceae bacterium]